MENSNLDDLELINNVIEKNCSKSLEELIVRHGALCGMVYKKYSARLEEVGFSFDDILKEKEYNIYTACKTYKPEKKVKFSTWVGNQARYQCLNILKQRKKILFLDNEEIQKHVESQSEPEANNENKDFFIDILSQFKDERIKKVYMLRYFSDYNKPTWRNIAGRLKMSYQTAITLHRKGKKILHEKYKSKSYNDII